MHIIVPRHWFLAVTFGHWTGIWRSDHAVTLITLIIAQWGDHLATLSVLYCELFILLLLLLRRLDQLELVRVTTCLEVVRVLMLRQSVDMIWIRPSLDTESTRAH